jgi:hypothetical protein
VRISNKLAFTSKQEKILEIKYDIPPTKFTKNNSLLFKTQNKTKQINWRIHNIIKKIKHKNSLRGFR